MQGKSKIQLDTNTVNILLKEFASVEGTEVCYQDGNIVVDKSGMKLTLTELPLKQTKLRVDGAFGTVNVELADFKLGNEEVSLDLDISMG